MARGVAWARAEYPVGLMNAVTRATSVALVGLVLAVGAVTAGLLAQSKFDSLRSSCGAGNPARPGCPQSDIDSVTSRQIMANVFWGLAGAAAVTTGVLFYFEGQPVTVAPVAGSSTGFIAAVRY